MENVNTLTTGDVIAGKFRIERVLGQGGMGVVVAARHLVLDEQVAIKFLLTEYAHQANEVARFVREAKAAIQIKNDHVVRVSDVGHLESGAPYMVMELLDGCDLGELLKLRGALPPDEVVAYLLQACEALAEAHSLGIVHRDLKPPNLFLTHRRDGTPWVKVLDFGISKFMGPSAVGGEGMTKTAGTMGSPHYMSPEQLGSAKNVDVRTDIWALGVIFYELLTGVTPFHGEHFGELVVSIMQGVPPPVRSLRPNVPEALEVIIDKCLAKSREARFASIKELARALFPLAPTDARASIEAISRISIDGRSLKSPLGADPSPPIAPTISGQTVLQTGIEWGGTGAAQPPTRRTASAIGLSVGAIAVVAGVLFGARALRGGAKSDANPSNVTPASPITEEERKDPRPAGFAVTAEPQSSAVPTANALTSNSAASPIQSGLPALFPPGSPKIKLGTSKSPAADAGPSTGKLLVVQPSKDDPFKGLPQ